MKMLWLGCLFFIIGLITSKAIISITTVYFIVVLFSFKDYKNFFIAYKRKDLYPFLCLIGFSFFSLIWSENLAIGFKELLSQFNFFVIPLLFFCFPSITKKLLNQILYFFIFLVVIMSFVNMIYFFFFLQENADIRSLSLFISHIRFALCIDIAIFLSCYFLFRKHVSLLLKFILVIIISWLLFYTYFSQVLTGVLCLIGALLGAVLYFFFKTKRLNLKVFLLSFLALLMIGISILVFAINKPERVNINLNHLPKYTKLGNVYDHYPTRRVYENGYPIYAFLCEKELDSTWKTRSNILLDSESISGFRNRDVLVRYLTSKGLSKDAEGINNLTEHDILNIENGVPSILYLSNGLMSRYYSLKYELSDKTNPNGHSILQRIEFWRAAIYIIKRNIIYGVGVGDIDEAFAKAYSSLNSPLLKENRLGSHNQFFHQVVGYGVIGLSLFLWVLIHVLRYLFKKNSFILFVIMSILITSFLVEDTLGTLTGMSIFSFFYGLSFVEIKEEII